MLELGQLWSSTEVMQCTWRARKGPLVTARLEARRLGWEFLGPFKLRLDTGEEIPLATPSPARWAVLAAEAYRRRQEEALAAQWYPYTGRLRADGTPTYHQKRWRLASEPLASYMRSRKWTAYAKAVLAAAVRGAVWTRGAIGRHGPRPLTTLRALRP